MTESEILAVQAGVPAAAGERSLSGMELLSVAVWFGMLTGLGEALLVLGFGFDPGDPIIQAHGWPIVWIAPVFNVLLFASIALFASAVNRFIRRSAVKRFFLWFMFGLTILDWLICLLYGRVANYAIVILAFGIATAVFPLGRRFKWRIVNICRRHTVSLLVLLAMLILGGYAPQWIERWHVSQLPPVSPERPNILVLIVDTLRADHLSCYGYSRNTSPNIDALAKQGTTFENAYASSSWTPPSHASMLTGRALHEHHAGGMRALDSRYTSISEVFSKLGYATGVISANKVNFSQRLGFAHGFDHFDDQYYSLLLDLSHAVYARVALHCISDHLTLEGGRWARRRGPSINSACLDLLEQNRNHASLTILNYMDVHGPYETPRDFHRHFGKSTQPVDMEDNQKPLAAGSQPIIDAYDDGIVYADQCIGELLSEMKRRGLDKNTLLVVTSDHGELLGEHGLYSHGIALYRELAHVPLFMRWPDHIPADKRIDTVVSNKDLAVTLMDLLGDKDKSPFPDHSLVRLWKEPSAAASWPPALLELNHKEQYPDTTPVHYGSMKSLVTSQFQLIVNQQLIGDQHPQELYDWKADPSEAHNLAVRKDYQETLKSLSAELEKASPGWW